MDRLDRIKTPTLVAVARDDACTPPYYADQLIEKIPEAELKLFEDGGHFVYLARPDDFNTAIREFIHKHDA